MAIYQPADFTGRFIGIVKEYNVQTREVAVYIPKLMPGISDTDNNKMMTNFGNSSINISYRNLVETRNSIWVRSLYYDAPMPEVDSRVLVWFLEGNPELGFWEKFNVNNDYIEIESERYPEYFTLSINGSDYKIHKNDKIEISLPDNYKITKVSEDKNCKYIISEDNSELERRLTILENTILNIKNRLDV